MPNPLPHPFRICSTPCMREKGYERMKEGLGDSDFVGPAPVMNGASVPCLRPSGDCHTIAEVIEAAHREAATLPPAILNRTFRHLEKRDD